MICDDLREWIELLRREGELAEIDAEVDPYLEITEIADRVMKAGGPALLFRNVKGSRIPLLINQFGTERRMCLAFGVETARRGRRKLADVLELQPPQGIADKLRALGKLKSLADASPKTVSRGALPGGRARRARPRPAADHDLLARRRRPVHHAALGDHEGPEDRRPQRRHVPAAQVRRAHDRPALADPQGRRRRLARGRRAHGGRDRARQRPDHDLLGVGAAAEARRRVHARGLPARAARRARAVQDRRPAGARELPRS